MIARYWSAKTTREQAPAYAHHLETTVFPELEKLEGYGGGMLLKRNVQDVIEVVVITFWKTLDSIRAFSGDDLEVAVVPDKAAALLNDFDQRVRHYDVVLTTL
jgi:heme-degrading monooxygenase HmoA